MTLTLTSCGLFKGETKYVTVTPTPCRVPSFPTVPQPDFILPCVVGDIERVCLDREYLDKWFIFLKQLKRWRQDVRSCRSIKEDMTLDMSYEYKIHKIMESF